MIEEIFQKIRPGANIKESKDIINDYSLDSFDVAGLIADIEEQYKINIAIEDINVENFRTYQSICDMIERNK
ncbi:MAG: acyl carrier protein [Candidatus Mucispirillum faecigallinarum]|nr:acyl carrier protein [Candidatus Mucispirillum faecigallinarum]